YAPWLDPTARIYRLFEFIEVRGMAAGTGGHRRPGPININNIWDEETFQAVCDAQASNGVNFTQANVQAVFRAMIASRSPGYDPVSGAGGPTGNDKPFLSMATGLTVGAPNTQYPTGISLANTFLRPDSTGTTPLFQVPGTVGQHPYLQYELMTKI